jgi:Protein of unknown function (DUF2845)
MRIVLCAVFLLCAATAGADTMRCKKGIISTGDSDAVLLAKCGSPTTVNPYGSVENRGRSSADINRLEAWLYNFGPYEFMYRVILKNGIVTTIENLGPGF